MTATDLTDFLRARLDEDEQLTRGIQAMTQSSGPARMLTDIDAKRRIVVSFAASEEPLTARTPEKAIVRMVLRLLALPYADHPDYRQEWKP